MNLVSPLFLFLFLPLFLAIYLVSNQKLRLPLVLAASILFLTAGQPIALLWLGGLLLTGYAFGYALPWVNQHDSGKKAWLWLGIGINLALLSFFKFTTAYGAMGLAWIHVPETWIQPITDLAIPVGLSYVTFQMISYMIDVWRGNIPAEKNFVKLATYLLFFPKIVSGPLARYKPFSEQLNQLSPSTEDVATGFRRLLGGFIKRTLIANQLGLVANAAFNLPTPNLEPRFAWLALFAYAFQIYFDFSGYTDMAIGLGMMVGIRLPENFNFPYIAQSISDFWRRWHITLTTWFREYVFYPLERRRFKWAGQQINILFVFLLTGLWHGFMPTFIVWGLLHGLAMALESAGLGRWLKNTWRPLRHFYTLVIVLIGWVFFRSSSLTFAFGFFSRLAGNTTGLTTLPFKQTSPLPIIEPSFILVMVVGILFCLPLASFWNTVRAGVEKRKPALFFVFQPLEDILLIALFVLGLAALISSTFAPNIYAKF
jgi:alginate O-acetyltransferase complex protein AlgI